MSLGQRGSEVTLRFAIDNEPALGSFLKVTEFTVTPQTDIMKKDYIGEAETDLDIQHHGFDFAFSVDNEDEKTLEYLDKLIERERDHLKPPEITITVIYAYRQPGAVNKIAVYYGALLKVSEEGFGGRKELVKTRFEGSAKRRKLGNQV